ncbi:MAG: hypothetical protein NUV69_00890 [Candidatus Curtissbacteria bacterium]|nr:hypothetical protein [Candidatus Curtissbacteria bacterium]
MTKGLVYYTNNKPDENIFLACQKQLNKCMEQWGFPIYSISQKPIDFGINTVMDLENSLLSMYKQIYEGLEQCQTDAIFLIEHDLLYHPSHFDFTPEKEDHFYYNRNQWHVSSLTGKTVTYLHNDTSQLCALREPLMAHIKRAIEVNTDRFHSSYGISPPRGIPPEEQKKKHYGTYMSEVCNVDIRHPKAFTRQRMDPSEFRSERSRRGWTESDRIPGWPGITLGKFNEWLKEVV